MKTFKFHSDPGHGWLAVKRQLLIDLGILNTISHCSFQKGKTIYLEEDCDAPKFLAAYKAKVGEDAVIKESGKDNLAIRTYRNFTI